MMWWITTGGVVTHLRRHFFGNRAGVPDPAGPVVIPLQPVADGAPADGGAPA